jgi:Tfp pilus assembly protein PilV
MSKKQNNKLSNQSGVGLVEAMLTFILLAFLLTAIVGWQNTNSWTIANANSREVATYKAQRLLDSLQAMGIYNIADSIGLSDCKDNTTNVKEVRDYRCGWTSKTLDWIPSPANSADTMVISKEVTVSVEWKIKGTPHTINITGAVQ